MNINSKKVYLKCILYQLYWLDLHNNFKQLEIMETFNTIENRIFRLECEKMEWRKFRTLLEFFVENHTTFGTNTDVEWNELKEELESIKYL